MNLDEILPVHGVGEPRPRFATLAEMFDHAVSTAPDTVALRQRGAALTYAAEGRAVTALACRIAEAVGPGEVVALLLPNSIPFVTAYFASVKALAVPALLNPLYPFPQLEPLLAEVSPRGLICAPETVELGRGLGVPSVIPLDDTEVAELAAGSAAPSMRGEPRAEDVAVLLFSGGTTGTPKAVEHTHARLLIALRCLEYKWPTRTHGEVWLPIAPFTHVYGFLQGMLSPVFARAEIVMPERFQPDHVVDLLSRHRVTVFGGGPPAIYAGVLAAGNLPQADLSALRICPAGGAPMPVELLERWRKTTGLAIHEGYGMTEMAPISGTSDLTGVRPGSVGKAIPCNDIQIVDTETGTRVLPPGERGEIRVRGPHMMTGYRNRPAETAATLRDGYIHTGDVGRLDADGFLFITDRKKDMVIVKGFNVFPRELEEVIHAHPAVASVGVVGVPDQRTGERLVAFVVPRAGEALDQAEIKEWVTRHLVAYKCPSEVRVVEALPMTGAQKLDRLALRRSLG